MTLMTVLLTVGVVLLFLAVLNRKALGNVFDALRAQVGKAGRAAANADPLANYQQAIDDAVENVKKAKQGMQRGMSLINSVERQVNSGTAEVNRLTIRVQKAVDSNDENRAREYAAALAEAERNLKANQEQLKSHAGQYNDFVAQVKTQQDKIVRCQREAQALGVQLQLSEANKEFTDFSRNFNVNATSFDGLSAQREAVLRKIDENNAAGRVEKDVGGVNADDDIFERQADADEVLKRFKKTDVA